MSLIAKSNGNAEYEPIPLGPQQAVCAYVVDAGTHKVSFQGQEKTQHKVVIVWELGEKKTRGEFAGEPFIVTKRYTLSLHEKAELSNDLENWFGKKFTPEQRRDGFDLEKLVGHNCILNMVEKVSGEKTYHNVGGIMQLPKTMEKIKKTISKYPDWIDDFRKKSLEHVEAHGEWDDGSPLPNEGDLPPPPQQDNLPF